MVLKIIATLSKQALAQKRLKTKSQLMIRKHWRIKLKKQLVGSILIYQLRKKSMKRSKKNWKELRCLSYKKWAVEHQVECLAACQVECLEGCQVECQIWEAWVAQQVPLLHQILQADP